MLQMLAAPAHRKHTDLHVAEQHLAATPHAACTWAAATTWHNWRSRLLATDLAVLLHTAPPLAQLVCPILCLLLPVVGLSLHRWRGKASGLQVTRALSRTRDR